MQYRCDLVKLFQDFVNEHPGEVFFVGHTRYGFPDSIYYSDQTDLNNWILLYTQYIKFIERALGEFAVFGEQEHATEIHSVECAKYDLRIARQEFVDRTYNHVVIDLFNRWHKTCPTATVLFKGFYKDLPEKIYIYNHKCLKDITRIQKDYIHLLQRLYCEEFVFGEGLPYAVDIHVLCPQNQDDVYFRLEGST